MKHRNALEETVRIERDELGSLEVPFGALYGVQTARALRSFPISGTSIGQFPDLIRSLALIKKAAARVNARLGQVSAEKAALIEKVCDEIMSGQHHHHFPVDVFQGGAGISTNMNMNEVIANRGLELLGYPCGFYEHLHPNDDVNRSQSTNDVYPTAIRIALMTAIPELLERLTELAQAFEMKGREFAEVPKLGRTELQDSFPMTLGAEMHAYGVTISHEANRVQTALELLSEINLGGTAIGTGAAAPSGYQAAAIAELAQLSGLQLKPAADLMGASWDAGNFVHVSGALKGVATKLSKIANDLRLLSSGPCGGLGEIRLPAMQPGSSIIPGKVNPVIAEMVNQVAFYVVGTDVTIALAAEAGQLQLNAFEPVMSYGVLQSVMLLRNVARTFRERCVDGIEADRERCLQNLTASTVTFATLAPGIGFEKAAELAKSARRRSTSSPKKSTPAKRR
jgi:aspartate ammonia-lyase